MTLEHIGQYWWGERADFCGIKGSVSGKQMQAAGTEHKKEAHGKMRVCVLVPTFISVVLWRGS